MIKLLTDDRTAEFKLFCSKSPVGANISAKLDAYSLNSGIQYFWYEESNGRLTAAFNRDGSLMSICSRPTLDEETAEFINFMGCSEVISEYNPQLPDFKTIKNSVLRLTYALPREYATEVTGEDIKDLFSVIYNDKTEEDKRFLFENWFPDASLKIRRGLISGRMIRQGKAAVSCALTSGETQSCAVISSVATLPDRRRNGYGKSCVVSLCNSLISSGKTVYLITDSEKNKKWYEDMGFTLSSYRYYSVKQSQHQPASPTYSE